MLAILHPHQEYTEVLIAPHHFQNLLLSFLDFIHSNMHVMDEVYSNLPTFKFGCFSFGVLIILYIQ